MHLSNYYQPSIQCYVVRILWMVPVYSIESWLCLRFRQHAIYIETARDCYESFVLYSFLQYLEQVLGGENELMLMLKDKSPTRGVHMSPLHFFVKPWLMGQPVTVTNVEVQTLNHKRKRRKQVQWTSPFYIKCKFGVLQYVILKLFTAMITMILELKDVYKEGDFSVDGGYLYICIVTNISQCWALYCLIFFYNATKNELAPIRPVGKFLSVKCIVFFTWWQSLFIGILIEMNLIPSYDEWSTEEVAKSLQAYLICIEMFAAAIVHTFVFPHTDYMGGRKVLIMGADIHNHPKHYRLGRRHHHKKTKDNLAISTSYSEMEMSSSVPSAIDWDEEDASHQSNYEDAMPLSRTNSESTRNSATVQSLEDTKRTYSKKDKLKSSTTEHGKKTNFVRALLDSAVPTDVIDNSVGIVKGDFHVEKKTLLHHAATSDEYDLFSAKGKRKQRIKITNLKGKGLQHGKKSQNMKKGFVKSKMNLNEFL